MKMRAAALACAVVLALPGLAGAQRAAANLPVEEALRVGAAHGHDAGEMRAAWMRAVAAHQAAQYLDEVQETIDVAVDLARGLRSTGAFSALDLMRQQAAQAEFAADAIQVRALAALEVDRLAHLLGTTSDTFALPAKL